MRSLRGLRRGGNEWVRWGWCAKLMDEGFGGWGGEERWGVYDIEAAGVGDGETRVGRRVIG